MKNKDEILILSKTKKKPLPVVPVESGIVIREGEITPYETDEERAETRLMRKEEYNKFKPVRMPETATHKLFAMFMSDFYGKSFAHRTTKKSIVSKSIVFWAIYYKVVCRTLPDPEKILTYSDGFINDRLNTGAVQVELQKLMENTHPDYTHWQRIEKSNNNNTSTYEYKWEKQLKLTIPRKAKIP